MKKPVLLYTAPPPERLPDDPRQVAVARMDVRALKALVREELVDLAALVRADVGRTPAGSAVCINGRTFG